MQILRCLDTKNLQCFQTIKVEEIEMSNKQNS